MIAHFCTSLPGTLPDYWEDNLTVHVMMSFLDYWQECPPVHILVAGFMDYKSSGGSSSASAPVSEDMSVLMKMFPNDGPPMTSF